ncbi:MAG TPA: hypothetical protein V6D17_04280 [Candidatus Obscuribacterales bacterium]
MNPNPILNYSDRSNKSSSPSKNQSSRTDHAERSEKVADTHGMDASPKCKNGVCMVTWKPQKPHAA